MRKQCWQQCQLNHRGFRAAFLYGDFAPRCKSALPGYPLTDSYDLPGYSDWETAFMGDIKPTEPPKPSLDYHEWLAKGRKIVKTESNSRWSLGDWLVEGQCEFDMDEIIDKHDRHLLISQRADADGHHASTTIPNFWKDAASETGSAVSTLKESAKVAREFPKKERFAQLTFTHHKWVIGFEPGKRREYLKACLPETKDGKPKSVDWLDKYIREQEGEKEIEAGMRFVRFNVPEETWKKLKQVAKHYRLSVAELVRKDCTAALAGLLGEQARKISLARYDVYEEGQWPFHEESPYNRKMKAAEKKQRKRARADHDPAVRARGRAMAINRWQRGEKVA
jgi:hypothetical protein